MLRPIKADTKMGAFELSVAVLSEAANMASGVPYMGAVVGIFVQIIRIKGVRYPSPLLLFSWLSRFFFFFVYRKSISIGRCGKKSCTMSSRSSNLSGTSARRASATDYATKQRFRRILSGL